MNGVHITGSDATANTLDGCKIGVQGDATDTLPNTGDGVLIDGGGANGYLHRHRDETQNIIGGNGANGIEITGGGVTGNLVQNNLIGLSGAIALPNTEDGILVGGSAAGNPIGTNATHNIICNNGMNGVHFTGSGTNGNSVLGNYIGTNATGNAPMANGANGILIDADAANNMIGGAAASPGQGAGNVISGNVANGIDIEGLLTTGNMVQGNSIGAQPGGTGAVANGNDGVLITNDAFGNYIGLAGAGTFNVISGNTVNGIEISGVLTKLNVVQNNVIGLDAAANLLPNGNDGVLITDGSTGNTIGETGASLDNVISGNKANGVEINGAGTSDNTVQNNFIGVDGGAAASAPNGGDGVLMAAGADG